MMLPKVVYELMPYGYMSVGVAEISYFKTLLTTTSGLLFFVAGALIWILRSNHRRTDPVVNRKNANNQSFYEMKPFLLIAGSVLVYTWVNTAMVLPAAALTAAIGTYLLLARTVNRGKKVSFRRETL